MKVTHKDLVDSLNYIPETGVFIWRKQPRQKAMSLVAGTVNPNVYRQICINQKIYKAHRLAWFYVNKVWPEGQIDHINGNRDDNRINNLRVANFSQNQANSKRREHNKCGVKGVYLHKLSGLYMARIMVNRKSILLGYFKTSDGAGE